MKTDELIDLLAADARPVRPLASLPRRLGNWLSLSLPPVAAIVWAMGLRADLPDLLNDGAYAFQQAASLATAITAAIAALASGVPGESRWKLWLPAAPLALWIGSLGHQCWQEWARFGLDGMEFRPDFVCVPAIAMVGAVPAIAMVALVRRGALFHPGLTITLAALAAGALANFGLRLFHTADAALMVLVWQFGSVALFTALASLRGRRLLLRPGVNGA